MSSPRAQWTLGVTAMFALSLTIWGLGVTADASSVTLTAIVSDRGVDDSPRDGVFDELLHTPSVFRVTPPRPGHLDLEERSAIEFDMSALPGRAVVDAATLTLRATSSLPGGRVLEAHGYAGDGSISLADFGVRNLVGKLAGPTAPGDVSIPVSTTFAQSLIGTSFGGFMFKGADGRNAAMFSARGTFSGVPAAQRPRLTITYHLSPPVPESATLLVLGAGLCVFGRYFSRRSRSG
jgi:hypothetical protein